MGGNAGSGVGGTSNDSGVPDAPMGCQACDSYGDPVSMGLFAGPLVTGLTGLAASTKRPGMFFGHSGAAGSARFFGFDGSGQTYVQFALDGANFDDCEDLAVGPCPAGTCLYFGDVGDKTKSRATIRILRVAEPDTWPAANGGSASVVWQQFDFTYEDGPRDAQTVLVHPQTGDLYVVSREPVGASHIYRTAPLTIPSASPVQLMKLGEWTAPSGSGEVTGGSIHPCSERILLRTYNRVWELRANGGDFSTIWGTTPIAAPSPAETEARTAAYLNDGTGYVTTSAYGPPELHGVGCK